MGTARPAVRGGAAAPRLGQLTLTGPVHGGPPRAARHGDRAERHGVRGVRDRGRAPLRRPREPVVDLERPNHPNFLRPHAAAAAPSPAIYRRLFIAGARGRARAAARAHDPDGRDRADRQQEPRLAARLPARRAVLNRAGAWPSTARRWTPTASRTQCTKRSGPRYSRPAGLGVVARPRAGPRSRDEGGRASSRPGHLPDRVRRPEPARSVRRRNHSPARRSTSRSPSRSRSPTRVKSFSQYLLADDPPRPRPAHLAHPARDRAGDSNGAPGRPTRPSAAARGERLRALGRDLGPRAAVSASDHRAAATGHPGKAARRRASRPTTRRLRAQGAARRRPPLRARWTAPDGTVFTGRRSAY